MRFSPRNEPCLWVFRRRKCLWQGGKREWNAWKLQLIDIDDDRVVEFVLGVHRKTRFHPKQNTLHILGWNGRYTYRKWMGSRLAGALHDFALTRFRTE